MKQVAPVFIAESPGEKKRALIDESETTPRERIWIVAFIIAAVVSGLTYVLITHHVWEDYLITFRHSKNLVEGKGLVFNPGERVQGFTSAINVMLPAFFYWITGAHGLDAALNLMRAASLIMFVVGGCITLRIMLRDRGPDRLTPLFFILIYITEAKTVAFTMNGQESAFMVAFLSLGLAAIYWGAARSWKMLALAFAGLLYTRPDAPIYIAALGITALLFRREEARDVWYGLFRAALVAGVVYLPWFIFTWSYYGQPIPNTALAKPTFTAANVLNPALLIKQVLANYPIVGGWIFEPIYASFGGWPAPFLDPYSLICTVIATIYCIIPSSDRFGRMASLMFIFTAAYMSLINVGAFASPWYLPSAATFSTIVLARAPVGIFKKLIQSERAALIAGRILQSAIVASSLVLLCMMTYEIRIQQRVIEDEHRTQVGLWLHDHVSPNEKIYLEPLGYIGYYSDRYIEDWPGLVSPKVVKLHREKKVDRIGMIPLLMPDWMVLRDQELAMAARDPVIAQSYVIAKEFDATPELKQYKYIPGINYLLGDARLFILHKKSNSEFRL